MWFARAALLLLPLVHPAVAQDPTSACFSTTSMLHVYSFRVAAPKLDPIFVADLGTDPQIRIHCLEFKESPQGGPCEMHSLPRLCKNDMSPSNCRSLAEFTYDARKEVTAGDIDGEDVKWLLLWDPRSKPASCYPREITVHIIFQLEKPNKGSVILAIVAIVLVAVLLVVLGAFGLSRLLDKTKQIKKNKTRKHNKLEGGQKLAHAPIPLVMCPRCGHAQEKMWAGQDVLAEMRCEECGSSTAGWEDYIYAESTAPAREQQSVSLRAAYLQSRGQSGITSAEVAAEVDTAYAEAVKAAGNVPFPRNLPYEMRDYPVSVRRDLEGSVVPPPTLPHNNPLDGAFPMHTGGTPYHSQPRSAALDPDARVFDRE